jgi:hypothetical protein
MHQQWSKEPVRNFLRIVVMGDVEKLDRTSELFLLPSLAIRLGQA